MPRRFRRRALIRAITQCGALLDEDNGRESGIGRRRTSTCEAKPPRLERSREAERARGRVGRFHCEECDAEASPDCPRFGCLSGFDVEALNRDCVDARTGETFRRFTNARSYGGIGAPAVWLPTKFGAIFVRLAQ